MRACVYRYVYVATVPLILASKNAARKEGEERTDCMNDDDEAYDAFVYMSLLFPPSFFLSFVRARARKGERRHIFASTHINESIHPDAMRVLRTSHYF